MVRTGLCLLLRITKFGVDILYCCTHVGRKEFCMTYCCHPKASPHHHFGPKKASHTSIQHARFLSVSEQRSFTLDFRNSNSLSTDPWWHVKFRWSVPYSTSSPVPSAIQLSSAACRSRRKKDTLLFGMPACNVTQAWIKYYCERNLTSFVSCLLLPFSPERIERRWMDGEEGRRWWSAGLCV
jgi:hypothetical protein